MALIKREFLKETDEPFLVVPDSSGAPPGTIIPTSKQRPKCPPPIEQLVTQSEEDIKSKAYEEAQRIIELARSQAEEVLESSRREGFETGKQEGWTQVGGDIKEALETLNQAVIEKNRIIKSSEPEILKLSIKIAEQIIRSEVSLNRDVCLSIVSEAISKVTDREQVIIRVNQSNLEQVRSQRERLASLVDGVKNLTIQEDAQVEPGGCIVETNLGYVDARISTKIAAIEEALKRVLAEEEKPAEGQPAQAEEQNQNETTAELPVE